MKNTLQQVTLQQVTLQQATGFNHCSSSFFFWANTPQQNAVRNRIIKDKAFDKKRMVSVREKKRMVSAASLANCLHSTKANGLCQRPFGTKTCPSSHKNCCFYESSGFVKDKALGKKRLVSITVFHPPFLCFWFFV